MNQYLFYNIFHELNVLNDKFLFSSFISLHNQLLSPMCKKIHPAPSSGENAERLKNTANMSSQINYAQKLVMNSRLKIPKHVYIAIVT